MLRNARRRSASSNHVYVTTGTGEDRQKDLNPDKSMVSCGAPFVRGRDFMKKPGQIPTILIVEDINWIRSGMREAVERQGYHVVEARNVVEAFDFVDLEPIELIVTEEELPFFNTLMARLREHPTLSSVPVVIINPDAEDSARLGDAYLLAEYADISSFFTVLHR